MVDTGALIALFTDDQHHETATEFRDGFLLRNAVRLFTTNYIHAETMQRLVSRVSANVARRVDDLIQTNPTDPNAITMLWVTDDVLERAKPIYYTYYDHHFSITDCTSFVLMQDHNINAAFTFDSDYSIYSMRRGRNIEKFYILPQMVAEYKASMIYVTWR
jgi:uncharacterized protein